MRVKTEHIQSISAAVVILTSLVILYFIPPASSRIYGFCVFNVTTGLDCAGCGTLRGMHALLHGRVAEALRYNAMLLPALPVGALFLADQFGVLKKGSRVHRVYFALTRWWLILGAIVVWTIVRNIS